MDSPDDVDPSGRAHRAVPLIAVALAVAIVAGLLYLRPAPKSTAALVSPSPSPPTLAPAYFPAYDFVTPTLGWAVLARAQEPSLGPSAFWIFRTDDGARHWRLELASSVTAWPGLYLAFFDRSDGVVAVGAAAAYRTSDGGAHWQPIRLPALQGAQVVFADRLHGWFAGAEVVGGNTGTLELYSTSDAGATWARLPDPPAGGFSFRGTGEGWGASQDFNGVGNVYSTWDGGQTWDRVPLPAPVPSDSVPYEVASVRLMPGSGVFAVTGDAAFVTFDHAATWRQLAPLPVGATFDDIAFQDATHWWVMPFGNLYRSADAGRTWRHVALRIDEWNYHVAVIDAGHAWAVLDTVGMTRPNNTGSALAMTGDGGRTWNYAKVPIPG